MTKSMLKSLKNSNTVMVPSSNLCNENRRALRPGRLALVMLWGEALKYPLHVAGVVLKLGVKETLFEGWGERSSRFGNDDSGKTTQAFLRKRHNLLDSKVASHRMLAVWLLLDSSVAWVIVAGPEAALLSQSPRRGCES